jgi:hypothetical protein
LKFLTDNPCLLHYFATVIFLFLLFGSTFLFGNLRIFRKWTGIGLIAAPIIYFFLILVSHTENIPYTDDFNLLETIYDFEHEPNLLKKVKILFSQVNQHRFAFERIVMLAMLYFTGTINIKAQILLGNPFLLGIMYLLFRTFRKEQISWYCFIPVPYVLFNLVYYENAFWGIAALQNTPLLFFAFLSAYSISRQSRKGWIAGTVTALIATFTSGSGLLAWIVGGLILGFQKRFNLLIYWIVLAAGVILFYFLFDYQAISHPGEKVWHHPFFNILSMAGFLGNALYLDIPHPTSSAFYTDLICCVLLGAGISAVFCFWLLRILSERKLLWSDWFLWGTLMFIMGTGAMFVISRPINYYLMNGGNIFSRRYMIFGAVLLATAYVALVILTKNSKRLNRAVLISGFAGFVLLNFVSYYSSLVQVRKLSENLKIDGFYWKNHATFFSTGEKFGDIPFWNHPTKMKNLIINLETVGLTDFYKYDDFPEHSQIIAETGSKSEIFKGPFQALTDYRSWENGTVGKYIRFRSEKEIGKKPSYFVLASEKCTVLLPAIPVPNTPMALLETGNYYSNQYEYGLFMPKLPKGKFQVWMMSRDASDNGKWQSFFTGKEVKIKY